MGVYVRMQYVYVSNICSMYVYLYMYMYMSIYPPPLWMWWGVTPYHMRGGGANGIICTYVCICNAGRCNTMRWDGMAW